MQAVLFTEISFINISRVIVLIFACVSSKKSWSTFVLLRWNIFHHPPSSFVYPSPPPVLLNLAICFRDRCALKLSLSRDLIGSGRVLKLLQSWNYQPIKSLYWFNFGTQAANHRPRFFHHGDIVSHHALVPWIQDGGLSVLFILLYFAGDFSGYLH